MCYMKQVAIYGPPRLVISDQGSQIKGATQGVMNWDKIAQTLL